MYQLKNYRGVMCHGNEEWWKISKRNWLGVSKLTLAIWQILTLALQLLLTKVYNFSAKKVQRSYYSWQWRVMPNFKEKLSCGLENYRNKLVNFHQSTGKSQKWDFDGILLSKVENVWA